MISTLKQRNNDSYYCSNCMFIQPTPLRPNCPFCGDWFSNYESVIIQQEKNDIQVRIENDPEIVIGSAYSETPSSNSVVVSRETWNAICEFMKRRKNKDESNIC